MEDKDIFVIVVLDDYKFLYVLMIVCIVIEFIKLSF